MNGLVHRPTAVSLTPLALEADSRTFRIACSLADAGLRSVVIEGRRSSSRFWGAAIEVRPAEDPDATPDRPEIGRTAIHRATLAMRTGRLGWPGELALYAGFRGYDWWRHYYRMRGVLPAAQLYYLHSFELHRVVAPMAAQLGARVIYDAHDFYRGIEPAERQRSFDRNRMRPFLNRLEGRLVDDADVVITVSNGVADLMETVFGRRPAVIRNCHDDRLDQAGAPDLRTLLGLTRDHRLCVVVGNWKPGMAVALAADAMALLPEHFHLAFVGRGYGMQAQRLRSHSAASRLHFGHHTTPNRVVPFIASADIGMMIYEVYSENYRWALPNGLFQTIGAGLPLVRAPLAEVEATIAGRDIGICLERLDAAALAQAILQCAEHREALRRNAAALAHALRWEHESERLQRLIEDVLSWSAGRPPVPASAEALLCG